MSYVQQMLFFLLKKIEIFCDAQEFIEIFNSSFIISGSWQWLVYETADLTLY